MLTFYTPYTTDHSPPPSLSRALDMVVDLVNHQSRTVLLIINVRFLPLEFALRKEKSLFNSVIRVSHR